MTIEAFKSKLKNTPQQVTFSETMAVIDSNYNFAPTAFKNGNLENAKEQNSGSCKLFAFAKAQTLTKQETLACFGHYYFNEVLQDPKGTGHQNIRNFIKSSFDGLVFNGQVLSKK